MYRDIIDSYIKSFSFSFFLIMKRRDSLYMNPKGFHMHAHGPPSPSHEFSPKKVCH